MLKFKRMLRSSNGRQKNHKRVVKKEVPSIVSDRRKAVVENITQELGTKLSPSIISLASFDGDNMNFTSTGIVLENSSTGGACVLTSSALVSTLDKERMLTPSLKIKLRLPNNEVVGGSIKHYDLPFSMVIIATRFSPDLRAACLNKSVQVEPHMWMKWKTFPLPLSPFAFQKVPHLECKVWSGSLNQACSTGRSGDKRKRKDFACSIPKPQEFITDEHTLEFTVDEHKHLSLHPWPSMWYAFEFTKVVNDILRSDGYPLPAYADRGMHLEGDFEEEFGIAMWSSESTRKVASMKSSGVVALASFNGKERHFACAGVSVDCNESTSRILTSASLVRSSGDENKIVDNLRIEVCLPMEQRIIGTLQHYDLSYNVAVAEIGGPLFDLNGNFVGMNLYDSDGTLYLPSDVIQKVLRSFYAERTAAAGITEKPNYRV
ncbi:hypothetical protein D1007_03323 [Hordeum vulgare]|nr:hypothetical protein D1007_03323 [Hordeum vulgare]